MLQKTKKIIKQQYLGIRGIALYALQLPLWFAIPINLIRGKILSVGIAVVAIALLLYAGSLTQEYFLSRRDNYIKNGIDHADIDQRFSALACTTIAAAVIAFGIRPSPIFALVTALIAALGYYFSYNFNDEPEDDIPPHRDIPDRLNPTLREMLAGGYDAIEKLERIAARLQITAEESRIAAQLKKVTDRARAIISQIGDEPERIRAARSFLIIHLNELRHISEEYIADIGNPDHGRQQIRFHNLLTDSEQSFTAQHLQLSSQQQEKLDTQMQVLREQLKTNSHE
ncbi:MAG: 5-bromo-4-chloroindolyl phosphate hydrolysis family protein [Cardiobacteriaceae bacterium]|nr:5-bromo-4-chloroindolyl phosphate hydrolysis family protein [Cardiobacteriaceae bacterium]